MITVKQKKEEEVKYMRHLIARNKFTAETLISLWPQQ